MTKLDEYIHTRIAPDYELSHESEDEYGNVLFWAYRPTTHVLVQLCVRVDPLRINMDEEIPDMNIETNPDILGTVDRHVRNRIKREFIKIALEELTSDEAWGSIGGVPIKMCYRLPEKTVLVSPDLIHILNPYYGFRTRVSEPREEEVR
jgi:hypothetical protein